MVTGSWQRSLGGHWKLAEVTRRSLEAEVKVLAGVALHDLVKGNSSES